MTGVHACMRLHDGHAQEVDNNKMELHVPNDTTITAHTLTGHQIAGSHTRTPGAQLFAYLVVARFAERLVARSILAIHSILASMNLVLVKNPVPLPSFSIFRETGGELLLAKKARLRHVVMFGQVRFREVGLVILKISQEIEVATMLACQCQLFLQKLLLDCI